MGNTSSERAGLERHGHKASRGDSSGGAISTKEGDRPKILMDSPEDADLFHSEEMKAPLEKEEFLAWQQDLEVNDKTPTQARPTVFRWTGGGKEVYLSGSFNNWSKIPLTRSHNNFVAILDLPEGEHQYKFLVDGQWTHDPAEPVVTSQLGTVNNIIQVKKTDFEVFDALMVDSQKCSDMSELLKPLSLNAQMLPRLQGLDGAQGRTLCASPAQAQPAPHRTRSRSEFLGPWAAPREQEEYTRPTVESSSQLSPHLNTTTTTKKNTHIPLRFCKP